MRSNRIVYGILIFLLLILAVLYEGAIVYAALYTFILLPVFSLAIAILSLRSFEVAQSLDSEVILKGETVNYTLEIKNTSKFFYPQVRLCFVNEHSGAVVFDEGNTEYVTVEILPGKNLVKTFLLRCKYRGSFVFGLDRLEILDGLGLFKFTQKMPEQMTVTVYPKLKDVDNFPFSMLHLTEENSRLEIRDEDYASVADIRKHEPSDGFKKIHWKLSAKKNEYLVKKFQNNAINTTLFLVDTNKSADNFMDSVMIEDKITEDLVAMLNFCVLRQFSLDLRFVSGGVVETHSHLEGFQELYRVVAEMSFSENSDFLTLIDNSAVLAKDGTNIIVFSHGLTGGLYEMLRDLRYYGHNVVLVNHSLLLSDWENNLKTELFKSGIPCL